MTCKYQGHSGQNKPLAGQTPLPKVKNLEIWAPVPALLLNADLKQVTSEAFDRLQNEGLRLYTSRVYGAVKT